MVPDGVQFCLSQFEAGTDAEALLEQLPLGFVKLARKYTAGALSPAPARRTQGADRPRPPPRPGGDRPRRRGRAGGGHAVDERHRLHPGQPGAAGRPATWTSTSSRRCSDMAADVQAQRRPGGALAGARRRRRRGGGRSAIALFRRPLRLWPTLALIACAAGRRRRRRPVARLPRAQPRAARQATRHTGEQQPRSERPAEGAGAAPAPGARADRGQAGGRVGDDGQGRVPGHHEPRDPHAAQRHHPDARPADAHAPLPPDQHDIRAAPPSARRSRCCASSTTSSTTPSSRPTSCELEIDRLQPARTARCR